MPATRDLSTQLAGVARELYCLRPAEFTATRDQLAYRLEVGGDHALAGAVRGLRRPSQPAWLLNLLAVQRYGDVVELFSLASEAHIAGERVAREWRREISTMQYRVVVALTIAARGLARAAGQPVRDRVAREAESALQAGLDDPEVAAAITSGLLTSVPATPSANDATGPAPELRTRSAAVPVRTPPGRGVVTPSGRRHAGGRVAHRRPATARAAEDALRRAAAGLAEREGELVRAVEDECALDAQVAGLVEHLEHTRARASAARERRTAVERARDSAARRVAEARSDLERSRASPGASPYAASP